MDHTIWALQTRYFAHHGRSVLAPDLPGHGRSGGPALESIAAMADWVDAFLQTAGIATAALVGHSMGALIALETAARFGARVRALALLGAAALMAARPGPGLAIAAIAWAVGIVLFSGALYALAFTGVRSFAHIAPLGGTGFLVGWAAVIWYGAAVKLG